MSPSLVGLLSLTRRGAGLGGGRRLSDGAAARFARLRRLTTAPTPPSAMPRVPRPSPNARILLPSCYSGGPTASRGGRDRHQHRWQRWRTSAADRAAGPV